MCFSAAEERPWRVRAPWHFEIDSATRALTEQFQTRDLAGFGCADKPLAIAAAGIPGLGGLSLCIIAPIGMNATTTR